MGAVGIPGVSISERKYIGARSEHRTPTVD